MHGLKSTLALLVVLVGLGAYIYFVASKQTESGREVDHVFDSFDAADVGEITVASEAGDKTTVRMTDEGWQITSPLSARASDSDVSTVTSGLGSLELVRVVDENPTGLDPYGLTTPRLEVEFKLTGGQESGRLRLGAKTPTGANVYAMRNDEAQVFMIPAYQESSFNKSTFDLRDKSLVHFERDQVTGLSVTTGGSTFALEKRDENWRLTTPVESRADSGTVESLISRLESARMTSVVADDATPDELQEYGLDSPRTSVTLDGPGATVLIGSPSDDAAVFAKDAARPVVFTVETSLADDMMRAATDYRRRDMFEFRAFNATRVEFTRDDQTLRYERVKGEGEDAQDSWRRTDPNPGDVDKAKMDALLVGLADIRATDFVDSTARTGLDRPILVVFASFDEGSKEERVTFGRQGTDVYASRVDDAGAARVETEKIDQALQQLDELTK